jgi:tRNA G18 (ribose-2'-O)-methylase SpoU
MNPRGFFEIGIAGAKTASNVGTLWRSAYQMGASGIFTVGARYPHQASDTIKAWRHVPMRQFADALEFAAALPSGCPLVVVEMGGRPLPSFTHPERAIYVLGAEDRGIPDCVLRMAHHVVSIPALRVESYNVAVAGSIVMYDRMFKSKRVTG